MSENISRRSILITIVLLLIIKHILLHHTGNLRQIPIMYQGSLGELTMYKVIHRILNHSGQEIL